MKKLLIMDIDQTLLDIASRLREYVNFTYGKNIEGHPLEWSLVRWLQVEDQEEAQRIIEEFSTMYLFATLDLVHGAKLAIPRLLRDGYDLKFITACGDDPMTVGYRKANLFNTVGEVFTEGVFMDYRESKADYIKKMSEGYDFVAFIDDKPEHVEGAHDIVDVSVLMKVPHNKEYREQSGALCVYTWYDVPGLLEEVQKTLALECA